jgi:hypothetical protein
MELHFTGIDTAGWTVRIELSSNNAPASPLQQMAHLLAGIYI